jgi:hypothetical protein
MARRSHSLADRAGIGTAAVCALHCVAAPWLIALAPVLGTAIFGEATEALLLATSLGISSFAMTVGGLRAPGRSRVILLVACGAVVLVAVRALGHGESGVERTCVLCGAGCLISGHALNIRSCRRALRAPA